MKAFLAVCLLVLTCWGQQAQAQAFDRLYADSPQPILAAPLQWVAVPKPENPSAAAASPAVFVSAPGAWAFADVKRGLKLPTSATQDVWLRLTVAPTATVDIWYLRMPRINLYKVSLYSQDAQGAWQVQSAGYYKAPAQWPLKTRTPTFELKTSTTQSQTYFLSLENPTPLSERPQLLSTIEYISGAYSVGAMMGVLVGIFSLVAALCIAAYAVAKNTHFLWLCTFVVLLLLNQLTLLGFTGWQLWPGSQHFNQSMPWAVSLAALAAATWLVARASYAQDTHPALYRLLRGLAVIGSLMSVATALEVNLIHRDIKNAWSAFMVVFITSSLLWLVWRGNRLNKWLLLGLLPIGFAAASRVAYNWGWLEHVEIAQLIAMSGSALGLLILLAALTWRSRSALLSGGRAQALADYDAETGLLLAHKAKSRLQRLLLRGSRSKLGSGVMMIRWVDADSYATLGTGAQRTQILRRIGELLRGAARDIDSVVRQDEGHFLILLEGPITRDALSATASQIMAASLRASDARRNAGAPLSVNLHIAMWQETLGTTSASNVMALLTRRLNMMRLTPQRRVQFIDSSVVTDLNSSRQARGQRQKEVLDKIREIEGEPTQTDSLR